MQKKISNLPFIKDTTELEMLEPSVNKLTMLSEKKKKIEKPNRNRNVKNPIEKIKINKA